MVPWYVDDVEDLGAMVIAQIVTVAVAVLAIVWNQQRTVAALRSEMRTEIATLRTEMREEIGALRGEMREEIGVLREEIGALRTEVAANGERLSRIEGYLGIGMSAEAAAGAAGAFITAGARAAQPQPAD